MHNINLGLLWLIKPSIRKFVKSLLRILVAQPKKGNTNSKISLNEGLQLKWILLRMKCRKTSFYLRKSSETLFISFPICRHLSTSNLPKVIHPIQYPIHRFFYENEAILKGCHIMMQVENYTTDKLVELYSNNKIKERWLLVIL